MLEGNEYNNSKSCVFKFNFIIIKYWLVEALSLWIKNWLLLVGFLVFAQRYYISTGSFCLLFFFLPHFKFLYFSKIALLRNMNEEKTFYLYTAPSCNYRLFQRRFFFFFIILLVPTTLVHDWIKKDFYKRERGKNLARLCIFKGHVWKHTSILIIRARGIKSVWEFLVPVLTRLWK